MNSDAPHTDDMNPEATSALILSSHLSSVGSSAITRAMAAVAAAKREGRDIIGLHVGEPDFETPRTIKDAAIAAIEANDTHYTAVTGSPALKAAIIEKFRRDSGLEFAPEEVAATNGAKMLIFSAFFATLDAGDEVIIPAPYWTNYPDIVSMMGATPVIVPTTSDTGFVLDPDDLERAITPRTRWLMVNSPNNPSGGVYEAADYAPIIEVLRRHPHVWMLADDMYEHLVYDGAQFVTPLQLAPDLRDRTLTINGVSKAYAMTGWRIGFAGGPAELMQAITSVISQSTSAPSSISQAAAAEALTGPQDAVGEYLTVYAQRRIAVARGINAVPGLSATPPKGAFYLFVDCSELLGRATPAGRVLTTDEDLCDHLLAEAGVGVIPGSAFGSPGHFRVSYAANIETLDEGVRRIREACAELR